MRERESDFYHKVNCTKTKINVLLLLILGSILEGPDPEALKSVVIQVMN